MLTGLWPGDCMGHGHNWSGHPFGAPLDQTENGAPSAAVTAAWVSVGPDLIQAFPILAAAAAHQ